MRPGRAHVPPADCAWGYTVAVQSPASSTTLANTVAANNMSNNTAVAAPGGKTAGLLSGSGKRTPSGGLHRKRYSSNKNQIKQANGFELPGVKRSRRVVSGGLAVPDAGGDEQKIHEIILSNSSDILQDTKNMSKMTVKMRQAVIVDFVDPNFACLDSMKRFDITGLENGDLPDQAPHQHPSEFKASRATLNRAERVKVTLGTYYIFLERFQRKFTVDKAHKHELVLGWNPVQIIRNELSLDSSGQGSGVPDIYPKLHPLASTAFSHNKRRLIWELNQQQVLADYYWSVANWYLLRGKHGQLVYLAQGVASQGSGGSSQFSSRVTELGSSGRGASLNDSGHSSEGQLLPSFEKNDRPVDPDFELDSRRFGGAMPRFNSVQSKVFADSEDSDVDTSLQNGPDKLTGLSKGASKEWDEQASKDWEARDWQDSDDDEDDEDERSHAHLGYIQPISNLRSRSSSLELTNEDVELAANVVPETSPSQEYLDSSKISLPGHNLFKSTSNRSWPRDDFINDFKRLDADLAVINIHMSVQARKYERAFGLHCPDSANPLAEFTDSYNKCTAAFDMNENLLPIHFSSLTKEIERLNAVKLDINNNYSSKIDGLLSTSDRLVSTINTRLSINLKKINEKIASGNFSNSRLNDFVFQKLFFTVVEYSIVMLLYITWSVLSLLKFGFKVLLIFWRMIKWIFW